MRISEAFKNAQRAVFQDKEIGHRKSVEVIGGLGSVTTEPGPIIASYLVNFQILGDAVLAKEWGLLADQDAFVTCSDHLPIEKDDYVQYNGKVYKVVGKPDRDSHNKLMLQLTTEEAV